MTTVSGTFTATGVSSSLRLRTAGENVAITVSNTYDATWQIERAKTPDESAWEVIRGPFTANQSPRPSYVTRSPNEVLRVRCTVYASGTITYDISDGDKIVEDFKDDSGASLLVLRQTGATFGGTLTVTGAQTFTGTATFAGTVDAVTGDFEVIEAGDASLGINGLDAAQGGAVVATGGTSSTAGNAGGAASLAGGTPGATGVGGAVDMTAAAGGATSGKGGDVTLTGGAGTAGNSDGGDAIITPGALQGSGLGGAVIIRAEDGAPTLTKIPAPTTATTAVDLTEAQLLGGIHVKTPSAAQELQVPTATEILAAMTSGIAVGDSFDFTIINLGGAADDLTLTVDTGVTFVGEVILRAGADAATEHAGQGTWRFRCTDIGTPTFIAYRVA